MTSKITILIGISGSGKSTKARELHKNDENSIIVNRDKLRELLFGYTEETIHEYYSRDNLYLLEKQISDFQEKIIQTAINKNLNIIIDNTNLKQKYINEFLKKFSGCDFEFIFIDCSVKEAIERDSKRLRKVGESVIKDQFNNLNILKKNFNKSFIPAIVKNKIEQSEDLPEAFIFDIDGTLAKMKNRSAYDYSKVMEDYLNFPVFKVFEELKEKYKIIICSGREDSCKLDTENWLKKYNISYCEIHMRKSNDYRSDYIVKEEMWKDICLRYNIIGMFDDRKQVVDHARDLGFTVFQVDRGDF